MGFDRLRGDDIAFVSQCQICLPGDGFSVTKKTPLVSSMSVTNADWWRPIENDEFARRHELHFTIQNDQRVVNRAPAIQSS